MELAELRKQIDVVDRQLVEAFEKRMQLCSDIAEYKIKDGKPVQDKAREEELLEKIRNMASSEFNAHSLNELFLQIITMSRRLQHQIMAESGIIGSVPFEALPIIPIKKSRVVYQGLEGAYSYAAMKSYFGEDIQSYNVKTFEEAMKSICSGMADYAILPIANSSAGIVTDVYDLLMHYDNYIVGEIDLKVEHVLLGLPDAQIEDIKLVYSHPQGMMQCSGFLNDHKSWKQIHMDNTAVSARQVQLDNDKSHAAIASEEAGLLFGLKVLKRNMTVSESNTTRFIIVSSKKIYAQDAKKVSICFEVSHEVGALYKMLSHLIYNNLSMTKIESRPIKEKAWDYRFFVDFEGNLSETNVKNALRGMLEEAVYFKILGNY